MPMRSEKGVFSTARRNSCYDDVAMSLALVLCDLERDVRVELAIGGDAVNGHP